MKQPSNIAVLMTAFLLDVNTWKYTVSGKIIIETIQDGANNQTPVTDGQFTYYIQYIYFRWATFVQHNDLTS